MLPARQLVRLQEDGNRAFEEWGRLQYATPFPGVQVAAARERFVAAAAQFVVHGCGYNGELKFDPRKFLLPVQDPDIHTSARELLVRYEVRRRADQLLGLPPGRPL